MTRLAMAALYWLENSLIISAISSLPPTCPMEGEGEEESARVLEVAVCLCLSSVSGSGMVSVCF